MLTFRLTITSDQRQALDRKLAAAQQRGDLRLVKFILAIFAVVHYQDTAQAAQVLQLFAAQVERHIHRFLSMSRPIILDAGPLGRIAIRRSREALASTRPAPSLTVGFLPRAALIRTHVS
jgi:hypothetical protein